MTARIALVDLAEGTVLAVRAALGAGSVRVCRRGAVPAGTALVILEADGTNPVRDDLELPDPKTPVLVLSDWTSRPPIDVGARGCDVLEKPFGSADLRMKVRALLEPGVAAASVSSNAPVARWLSEPLLEAPVARALAAVRAAGGSVWLVGEPGTGLDEVAAALALASDPEREPVVWQEDEPLAVALVRLGDPARVLWAPAIDERTTAEQRALERYLALEPRRRVIATGGDDPERAVAAGTLAESLVARLSRTSLRLAPLRERRRDLAALASAIAGEAARQLAAGARVVFTERAKHALGAYGWPHNLVELEAVLTRSVLARNGAGAAAELDADDLLFAPSHLAPLYADDGAESEPAPRRALVVALGDVAAARASAAAASERAATASAPVPTATDAGIEGVLAGFAHDIRNPMSTIKTFAGLEASREGSETAELARLAAQACERVDEQLDLLQRYSELGEPSAVEADLVEILGEAAEAAGAEEDLVIAARRALAVRVDAALARLVADAIVAECRARRAPESGDEPSVADIGAPAGPGTATLEITIPTGRAAVDRLDKWVAGTRFPWRLALARDAARRGGGSLEVEVEDGQLRVAWRVPAAGASQGAQTVPSGANGAPAGAKMTNEGGEAVGEAKHDDQTGSSDRRRRSRSS